MAAFGVKRVLDLSKMSESAQKLLDSFSNRVVGQEKAVTTLVDIVEAFKAGFCDTTRPLGNVLFLGPTGSGKTHVVESLAYGLFGDTNACIKIDCAEFQHSHEIAKLIGSPPGYLGHRETSPVFTQEALSRWHRTDLQMSIVLFDEIEKASDALWSLMRGIMDKGSLTTGANVVVDFTKTLIVMTSNLGAEQIDGGLGFASPNVEQAVVDSKLEAVAMSAVKSKFTPEFLNRIQNIVTFKTLTKEQIEKITDLELGQLKLRMFLAGTPFVLHVTEKAKAKLIEEGFDKAYGARHLKRAIERRLQKPLAKLVTSQQITNNMDVVADDTGEPEFEFYIPKEKP